MDITSILAYQEVDKKLYNLEQDLAKDPNKKRCNDLNQTARTSQQKSSQLEEQAGAILKELSELKKSIDATKKHGAEVLSSDVSELTVEQIDEAVSKKDRITSNLTALDKRLTKLAENINHVLSEFNRTIKLYNEAKQQYQKFKAAYDAKVKESEPKMTELSKQLAALEKNIDPKTLEIYKAKRADKIFPVFVQLLGNTCGRCRMELSASAISKLKNEQILTCENCRSVIYYKQ